MKINGWWYVFIIFFIYVYFINRDIGVNVITPLFNTFFPWVGVGIFIFAIGYTNREKLSKWSEHAKLNTQKLKGLKNIQQFPISWVWLIVVIAGIAFSFYWFSVRPEQIKKDCNRQSYYGTNYYACLRQHGLE